MTKIKYRAEPVWHESHMIDSLTGRPILVAETPSSLKLRLKGTRHVFDLPWGVALYRAAVMEATLARLAKGRKRKVSIKRGM